MSSEVKFFKNLSDNKKLEVAEPYQCVPAVLSIIFEELVKVKIPTSEIASHFTINVSKSFFEKANLIGNIKYQISEPKDFGIVLNRDSINNLLRSLNLPLKEIYIPYTYLDELSFSDLLGDYLAKGNGIVVGYDYGLLNNGIKNQVGHASLISKVINWNLVELYDPGPEEYGYKDVKVDDLFEAIKAKEDGVWIISKTI